MAGEEGLGFEVSWHDKQAELVRGYQLTVFIMAKGPLEVSMYDPKARRSFLKRSPVPGLAMSDIFLGGSLTLHGRQLKVVGFLDERTKQALELNRERLLLATVPSRFYELGKVLACLEGLGLTLARLRLVNDAGPVVAMEAVGADAALKWGDAERVMPAGCARRLSAEEAAAYFDVSGKFGATHAGDHCSLCVLRPHVLKARQAGLALDAIVAAGFEISAARTVHMSAAQAADFLEVYQNVMPNFRELVAAMSEAACLALELRKESNVVEDLRTLCGPYDVDMARHLRPESLRARFGQDNARSGAHCTDLEEDAEREVRYLFELLP